MDRTILMKEQLVGAEDTKARCPYCAESFKGREWKSRFHSDMHYKVRDCSCGKCLKIKVDFVGSGHDSWDQTFKWFLKFNGKPKEKVKLRTLDAKIQIIK